MPPKNSVTLAVLAGGEGSRMGGPKAWLRVQDEPILQFLLKRWNWEGPKILVTAPTHERPPGWEKFDDIAVDAEAGGGPLVGVLAALRASTTSTVVVATCDMPSVGSTQLEWIANQLAGNLGVMCRHGEAIEPFPSAFATSAADVIEGRLTRGLRAAHSLVDVKGFVALPVPSDWDESVWTNLNRPEDLKAFLRGQMP